jgi:hypothetical protein
LVQKNFLLSYLLFSSRPRVYRSLGKSLERTFSLFPFGLQPDKFPWLSRPLLFFLDYSVSFLNVENSRTHLPVLDFSFCRQSLRSVFLHQDWVDFFGEGDKYTVPRDFSSFSCKYRDWVPFGRRRFRFVRSGEKDLNPKKPRGTLHPYGNEQQNIRLQSPRNHGRKVNYSLRTPGTPLAPKKTVFHLVGPGVRVTSLRRGLRSFAGR